MTAGISGIHFGSQSGLLLMAVLVPLLSVGFLLTRLRKSPPHARPWRLSQFILQLLLMVTLGFAASEPYLQQVDEDSRALVLVDISDSMDEAGAQSLLDQLDGLRRSGVHTSFLPFAGEAPAISAGLSNYRALKQSFSKLDIGKSNLELGLQAAAAQGERNVLLISDGQENRGDAERALSALAQRGIRIFPLVPPGSPHNAQAFRISNLYAPLVAPAEKSVEIRSSIVNTTGDTQSGLLEILHGEKTVLKRQVRVAPGQELLVTAESDPSKEGIREITARLTPAAALPPSSETVYLAGQEREKVLLLSGSAADERFLAQVLRGQAYQVESQVVGAEAGYRLPADLSRYSAIIFNNAARQDFVGEMPQRIKTYVEQGGGFLMVGGPRSFGLGGYIDTPIGELLPVELVPPQAEQKRLNTAVELVLDKSKSMGFENKIDFEKEAAKEVVRNLKNEDYVGIIGFDASPFIVVRLGLLSEVRETALGRIDRLIAYGRTNLLPALDEARRALDRVNAGRKHVIILTDGKVPGEGSYFLEMVKQMRLHGITISSVLLGGDVDPGLLRTMAEEGGGSFYQTSDARNLPRIFLKDVKIASGEQTLQERSEYLVRRGTGTLTSTGVESYPPLRGYVQTKAKPRANLELVTFALDRAEPLLASWQFGKGKAIAFTSDANGRWSSSWIGWPRFAQFWSDLINAARPETPQAVESPRFDLRYAVEKGALELDLAVFSDLPGGVSAEILLPDGSSRNVDFTSLSRGRYHASMADARAGRYELRGAVGQSKLTAVAFHLSGELFGEKKGLGFNVPLLQHLAETSGGKMNPAVEELKDQTQRNVRERDITHWFLFAALVLFLVEVLRREAGLPLFALKLRR